MARVAGGLDAAAQLRLSDELLVDLRPRRARPPGQETGVEDMARLAAVLERVPAARKVELGRCCWRDWRARTNRRNSGGRRSPGTRVPAYGSAHDVMSVRRRRLAGTGAGAGLKVVAPAAFAATLLARLSGDRERDLEEALRVR